jgi:hypothetical protein
VRLEVTVTNQDDTELVATATVLGGKVDRLTEAVQDLNERTTSVERRSVRQAIAAVLAIAVIVFIGWLAYTQVATNERVRDVIVEQERQRADALCPVFALLLGGYDPSSRAPGEAQRAYEETFAEYRRLYATNACTTPLVPPRVPG